MAGRLRLTCPRCGTASGDDRYGYCGTCHDFHRDVQGISERVAVMQSPDLAAVLGVVLFHLRRQGLTREQIMQMAGQIMQEPPSLSFLFDSGELAGE